MPRLLSINNYYYQRGGAETVFFAHNRLFEEIGWEVGVFAMHHPQNLPSRWSKYFVEKIEYGDSYSLAEKLALASKIVYSFEARRKLGKLLNAFAPDICHAHNIYHHISPSILSLLRTRGIPLVLTLHDLKMACPAHSMLASDGICERCKGGRLYNVLVHRCVKRSRTLSGVVMLESMLHHALGSYRDSVSYFVVPSRFYASKFAEWGFRREQFVHVPNFVDISRYVPRFSPGDRFVYVGRLSPEKGIPTLIQAVARAGCALSIIGAGPQETELRSLAASLGVDVHFLGYQTGPALHSAVREARALVLPSECYENAPMSILEAYALGKPVLGANVGGIPELIREGVTGYTFASGNVESLAAALRLIIDMPNKHVEALGLEARTWVANDFSLEQYRERILAVYRSIGAGMNNSLDISGENEATY